MARQRVLAVRPPEPGALQTTVKKHPLLFFTGALGAGYLVGGGLASGLTGRLMRIGTTLAWRFVVQPALSQTLTNALGGGRQHGGHA